MRATEEAIVLVGGLGTRLRSVVSDLPKPLACVAGRPFLAWLLDRLADGGIRRVILAAGYRAEQVQALIGTRWRSMDVAYSVEDRPLGTGGAVGRATAMLQGTAVHVLNGDTFLDYDCGALERLTHRVGARLGMTLARVGDVARYGAIECDRQRVVRFREKGEIGPGLINAGSYFLTAQALAALPDQVPYSFETEVLAPLVQAGEVAAFDATAGFIDIGVPEDYLRAQDLFGHR